MKTRAKQKGRKKLSKGIAIILVIIIITGGFLYYWWDKVNDTVKTMHNPLERDQDSQRQKELDSLFKNKQPINILLLGVDERAGDKGRSDTMILISLNPKTDSMIMFSIPRDTYVNIPGHGKDKINHAYAFGGVPLSIETVENTFDLPVDFYSHVNMEGFKDGIDAINGVTVNNQQSFSQGKNQFNEGEIDLNGSQALDYIRMRKNDPRGDLGRNERQRDVIMAAMNKAANFSSITKVGTILDILGDNVKTNLDMSKLQILLTNYRDTRNNIKTLEIKGDGQTINEVWYYIVSDKELNYIHSEITNHMK